jgi:ANTAR domain
VAHRNGPGKRRRPWPVPAHRGQCFTWLVTVKIASRGRALIEQAKGILIAQHGGSADEAFERLREFSQHSNIKLRDVARRIVEEYSARTNGRAHHKDIAR